MLCLFVLGVMVVRNYSGTKTKRKKEKKRKEGKRRENNREEKCQRSQKDAQLNFELQI